MSDNIFLRAAARIKSIISAASPGKLYKSEKSVSVGRAFRSGTCPNAVRHVPPAERNKVPLASIKRNRYLVDHAACLLAIYDGEWRGGTAMTVRYAKKLGRKIIILNPRAGQTAM